MTKAPHAETQLEIIPPSTAEKLDVHEKNIRLYINGQNKGAAEMFGYAFLAGREMLLAKAVVPHGNSHPNAGFKDWLEARFPKINYRSAARRMVFAEAILSKTESVSLFKQRPLLLKRGKLTVKDRATMLEVVPQIMEGKSMLAFCRDFNLLRDPEKPTHHPRKKLDPDKALAAKQKQAKRLWTAIFADLNLAADAAKYLPDDSRVSAAFELTKYLPALVKGLARKHAEQILGTLVDLTSSLRETLKKS